MTPDSMLSIVWLIDGMNRSEKVALAELRASLAAVFPRYEIVIVTRDGDALPRRFTGADPYLSVVVPQGRDEGAALAAGCVAMKGEYALIIVGDAMPDWAALPALVPFLGRGDIVASFAVSPRGKATPPFTRYISPLLVFLFGVTVREPFNPMKLYRAELLQGLTFVSRGAALPLELLAKTRMQGAVVTEVGVPDWRPGVDILQPSATQWLPQMARLWLHMQLFRVPWIVRSQPTVRPASVYAVWGAVLAACMWLARDWFARMQDDR